MAADDPANPTDPAKVSEVLEDVDAEKLIIENASSGRGKTKRLSRREWRKR